jgi:hypothetical protein
MKIEPRNMTREEAAAYCRCETVSAFNDWVRRGIICGPIPGTHRWDRKALDASLDRASGLVTTIQGGVDEYEAWKASEAAAQGN